ncbi:MAG: spore germination protein [Peptococcaceae bacterium]|nr:spore germination protein [Peptococcaceae bacterium]
MSNKSSELSSHALSAREAVAVVMILTFALDIRVLPLFATQPAGHAGWLAVLLQFGYMLFFFHIFYKFLISFSGQNFAQIAKTIWGRTLGFFVVFSYILWLLLILSFNINMFGARLSHSQYPGQNKAMLIAIFVVFAVIVVRSGIVPIARMTRLCFFMLVTIFIILIVLWLPSFRWENFMPVTYLDLPNAGLSSLKVLYTGAFSVLILVLSDKIASLKNIRRIGFKSITLLSGLKVCVVLAAIGILGPQLISRIPFTLNTMINSIAFSSSLERIDSFLGVLFTVAEFMFIAIVSFCFLHLIRSLFGLDRMAPYLILLALSLFFGGNYIGNTFFALHELEEAFIYPLSLVMGFVIPLLLYVTGKIRRVVQ